MQFSVRSPCMTSFQRADLPGARTGGLPPIGGSLSRGALIFQKKKRKKEKKRKKKEKEEKRKKKLRPKKKKKKKKEKREEKEKEKREKRFFLAVSLFNISAWGDRSRFKRIWLSCWTPSRLFLQFAF